MEAVNDETGCTTGCCIFFLSCQFCRSEGTLQPSGILTEFLFIPDSSTLEPVVYPLAKYVRNTVNGTAQQFPRREQARHRHHHHQCDEGCVKLHHESDEMQADIIIVNVMKVEVIRRKSDEDAFAVRMMKRLLLSCSLDSVTLVLGIKSGLF